MLDPCNIAAHPPTRTKSTPESTSRSRSCCRSLTQLTSGALDLERKVERVLMLHNTLLEAQAQIFLDQRQIDSGAPGGFNVGA